MTDEETIAEGIRIAKAPLNLANPPLMSVIALVNALLIIDKQRKDSAWTAEDDKPIPYGVRHHE